MPMRSAGARNLHAILSTPPPMGGCANAPGIADRIIELGRRGELH